MAKGEKKADKAAPNMAADAMKPIHDHNELLWSKSLASQLGATMSVRLMDRTRVAAGQKLAEYITGQDKRIQSWTREHYSNYQNAMNMAIRRAEDTGVPVNLMDVARKAIDDEIVPPNDKIRNRARLIARDQSAKFAGSLDRIRAEKLGATYYQWRSVQDQRVRDDHREWNGKYFRKDGTQVDKNGKPIPGAKGTDGEQPRDAVQCRCSAAWVIPI